MAEAGAQEVLGKLGKLPEEVRQRLEKELRATEAAPPVEELEAVLRERFTEQRARKLLFRPGPGPDGEARFYPLLVCSPPDGAPREHPQLRLQRLCLSLFYLVHVHDPEVAFEFVVRDGLSALAQLVAHENMVVRAQALESFMALTGSEHLDWFQNPPGPRQVRIHPGLLRLTRSNFLEDLLENYNEGFPGGSFLALQILAFYLSWLRLFYCPKGQIRVSRKIIDTLRDWSERGDLGEDERDFAKKLYEDFGRFPAQDSLASIAASNESMEEAVESAVEATAASSEAEDSTGAQGSDPRSSTSLGSGEQLSSKAEGNSCFVRGEYARALEYYEQARETWPAGEDQAGLARVLANAAAAHMELLKQLKAAPDGVEVGGRSEHLAQAVSLCKRALELDASYVKAQYRLAQALLEDGQLDAARQAIERGQSLCTERGERAAFRDLHETLCFQDEEDEDRKRELLEIYHAVLSRLDPALAAEERAKEQSTMSAAPAKRQAPLEEEQKQLQEEQPVEPTTEAKRPPAEPVPKTRAPATRGKPMRLADLRKASPDELVTALLALDAPRTKALFGDNLDEGLLEKVISTADGMLPARAADVLHVLGNVGGVNRLSLVLMFVSPRATDRLASIFAILKSALRDRPELSEAAEALAAKYK